MNIKIICLIKDKKLSGMPGKNHRIGTGVLGLGAQS